MKTIARLSFPLACAKAFAEATLDMMKQKRP
jgi:hypothetical protein